MQHPASQPVINPTTIDNSLLEEYVAARFLRKMKSKVSQENLPRDTRENGTKKNIFETRGHCYKLLQFFSTITTTNFQV